MRVEERHHRSPQLPRRSRAAGAKYTDAVRRISVARRHARCSRSSALTRACSSVVTPGRCPVSRSVRRTHFRRVSAEHPILLAVEVMAPHCVSHSERCACTSHTARSCTAGATRVRFVRRPSAHEWEPPAIPGRFIMPCADASCEAVRRVLQSARAVACGAARTSRYHTAPCPPRRGPSPPGAGPSPDRRARRTVPTAARLRRGVRR